LISRRSSYLAHPNAAKILLVSPDFDKAVRFCAVEGGYTCMWAMFGLASVLRREIVSIYPMINDKDEDGMDAATVSNITLNPLSDELNIPSLHIMWTRVESDGPFPWTPNHFVALLKRKGSINFQQ